MIRYRFRMLMVVRWWLIFATMSLIGVYMSVSHLSKASLYGILNVFTVDLNEESVDDLRSNLSNEDYSILSTFAEHQTELTSKKVKIFFIQTSKNGDILSRHGCSIESAARLHPNGFIFVFMRSRFVNLKRGAFRRLKFYANIRFVHFDEEEVYSGTSLAQLKLFERRQYIRYFAISHMSDFIRTALLYKYGGIYFDLDVIPLRNFSSFINTVGLESTDGVNVAVLAFEKQHLALDIQMDLQIASMKNRFHSFCWNCVGPSALSKALKKLCDYKQLSAHVREKCQQIDIQPSFVFYPVDYQKIPEVFHRSSSSNFFDSLVKNSSIYSIHYFHHMTMNLPIQSSSTFDRLAQIFCPHVYDDLFKEDQSLQKHSSKFNTRIQQFLLIIFLFFIAVLITSIVRHFASFSTFVGWSFLQIRKRCASSI